MQVVDENNQLSEKLKNIIYKLNCIECGYIWQSRGANWAECPMSDSVDMVVMQTIEEMNKTRDKE